MLIKEVVSLGSQELVIDLIIIDVSDFDVIFDINLLSKYRI